MGAISIIRVSEGRSIYGISKKDINELLFCCTIQLLTTNMDDFKGNSRTAPGFRTVPSMICSFENLFHQKQCKHAMNIGVV